MSRREKKIAILNAKAERLQLNEAALEVAREGLLRAAILHPFGIRSSVNRLGKLRKLHGPVTNEYDLALLVAAHAFDEATHRVLGSLSAIDRMRAVAQGREPVSRALPFEGALYFLTQCREAAGARAA